MARLYCNFETNILNKDLVEGEPTPNLSELVFKTANGDYMFISSAAEDDFELSDGVYDGRWKGLEYRLEDENGYDLMENHDWCREDNTKEFKDLLTGAEPVAFYMDEDALKENGYSSDFVSTCKNCNITIEIGDEVFDYHKDELMEECEFTEKYIERKGYETYKELIEAEATAYEQGRMMRDDSEVELQAVYDDVREQYMIALYDYSESRGSAEKIRNICRADRITQEEFDEICDKHQWAKCVEGGFKEADEHMLCYENDQIALNFYKSGHKNRVWDPRKENSEKYEHVENMYGYTLTEEPVYSAKMTLKDFAFRDGDCRERYPENLEWDVDIPADTDKADVQSMIPDIAERFLENYKKGESINVAFMMAHATVYGNFAEQNWLEKENDERDL